MPHNIYRSRLHLNPEQVASIKHVIREKTQHESAALISEALFRTKICSEAYSSFTVVYQTVRRVFGGERAVPYALIEGVLELCEDDERLQFLRRHPGQGVHQSKLRGAYQNDPFDMVLLSYFDQIRDKYTPLEKQAKIEVLGQLEEVVKRLS